MNGNAKSKAASVALIGLLGLVAASMFARPESAASDCPESSSAQDDRIDIRLETAYLFNPHLNNFTIDTEVEDGRVLLSGTVRSEIDKDLAGEIAKSVEGVNSVQNSLEVRSGMDATRVPESDSDFFQKVSDATTTARVKTRLIANENLTGSEINVDTENKIVRLTGQVGSSTESQLAAFIAKNTSGVESVSNELEIRKSETTTGS